MHNNSDLNFGIIVSVLFFRLLTSTVYPQDWNHLATESGDLEPPNTGNQQTALAVFDIDQDGVNDFVIAERTQAPAVVWYKKVNDSWEKYVIEDAPLRIEAGSAVNDIDGDGDLDVVFGGDAGSNQVWWWENPHPDFDKSVPWRRHSIKEFGGNKHHDQIFGDFDGDNIPELVFWNQGSRKLFLAEIPSNPRVASGWDCLSIYDWEAKEPVPQRGNYPGWKDPNEHEGLAKADIDGDGIEDIVGGGRWFKNLGNHKYVPHPVDKSYAFSRSAAGQLINGGHPEIILVVGDGNAPLIMYEYKKAQWVSKILIESVQDGHSLSLIDFNNDGNLDIFNAEMRLGQNPDAKTWILLGDGQGNFQVRELLSGYGLHESQIADLDGDTDLDILGKPYTWEAPRLDIWLNLTR